LTFQGLANFDNSQAFIGGFSAFARTFVYAFFSYGGIELVTIAAGESAQPYKTVPRAIKATFFRIVLFYILTILTMGLCINYRDPTLLSSAFGEFYIPQSSQGSWLVLQIYASDSDVAASPLTVVFVRTGFGAAAHVVNAVLLTAVLSVTNSCFYASSRMLLSLARSGQAPRIFGWVNSRGVPVPALM
jgi:amino acid permease